MEPHEENVGRIAYLHGQALALTTFAHALIRTHHAKVDLAREFQASSQAGLANIETAIVPEETVEGFQALVAELERALSQETS